MKITATSLPGVLIVEPVVHRDARGFFVETYQAARYPDVDIPWPVDVPLLSGRDRHHPSLADLGRREAA